MSKPELKTMSFIIDSSKLDVKNMEKVQLSEFNMQEIRGWIIDQLNEVESKIDLIITNHFKPGNEFEFRKIILNSSIVSSGAKLKILRNIPFVENNIIGSLQKLLSIRNAFAHAPMTISSSHIFEFKEGKLETKDLDVISELAVMNSNGEIKNSSVKKLSEDFEKLLNEMNPILDELIQNGR